MKSESYFKKILLRVDGSHSCLHVEELAVAITENFKCARASDMLAVMQNVLYS